jgi:hypothetical protein
VRRDKESTGGDRFLQLLPRSYETARVFIREAGEQLAAALDDAFRQPPEMMMDARDEETPMGIGLGAYEAGYFVVAQLRLCIEERLHVSFRDQRVVLGVNEEIVVSDVVAKELSVRKRQGVWVPQRKTRYDLGPRNWLRGIGEDYGTDPHGELAVL